MSDPRRAEEIERARQAIEAAPKTESGIIIPPHVAEQRRLTEGVKLDEAPFRPSRAQRRAWERAQRAGAKKIAKKAAREARERRRGGAA